VNAELFAELAAKNSADLEAIIATVGIANCIKLFPHIVAIVNTLQQEAKPNAQAPTIVAPIGTTSAANMGASR
jgi:hypothetical protein